MLCFSLRNIINNRVKLFLILGAVAGCVAVVMVFSERLHHITPTPCDYNDVLAESCDARDTKILDLQDDRYHHTAAG